MNILQLISSEGFYGAENVVAALTRDLQASGYSVVLGVFENAHARSNVAAEFESRGLPVTRISCRHRFDPAAIKKIREVVHAHNIELVHSHGYKSDIYAWLAARHMRLPLIATSHLWTRQTAAIRVYEFLDARVLRRLDAVVAVSDRIAGDLCQAHVPARKIRIIDNGIDLRPFNSAVPVLKSELNIGHRLLIGSVGRLVAQKGLPFFLQAARHLLKEFPDLQFVVTGDGPDRLQLEQMARDLGIESRICFTGARRDMPNIYASLDVFVLASLNEGLPMALLEAMASGAPVVATQVGAIPKVVIPGKNGMLVHPKDPNELAQAIACYVRDPALRDRLSRNARQDVHERFSSQAMTENYCKLYGELAPQRNQKNTTETLRH